MRSSARPTTKLWCCSDNVRILVIAKRQYSGRDLLGDRYGRLFEIPAALAAQGHEVRGLVLSYRPTPEGIYQGSGANTVRWESMNGVPFLPPSSVRHLQRLRQAVQEFNPDVVWASSDAWHAIAAWWICRAVGVPYVVDLYDNYEHFGLTRLPGVKALLRLACRNAVGLTVVSNTLDAYVRSRYRLGTIPSLVLGNAVDPNRFRHILAVEARRTLGLPESGMLIGTAGALDASRQISTLVDAFGILSERLPSLHLVLAGPCDRVIKRLRHPRVIYLGDLPAHRIPYVFSALDVAVICNRDSDFGRYCYPQKFQEIIACGTPIVAANVGEMSSLLADRPDCLFPPESPATLAMRLEEQLHAPHGVSSQAVKSWHDRATSLSSMLERLCLPLEREARS